MEVYSAQFNAAPAIIERCIDARTVFLFVNKNDEPDTRQAIKSLLDEGKEVIVPVIEGDVLKLCRIKSMEMLLPSTFGVYEPIEKDYVEPSSVDIYFVPGTLFDERGNRKGRGRGYFDRFLAQIKQPVVGVCFRNQFTKEIPVKPWDVPVDELIVVSA